MKSMKLISAMAAVVVLAFALGLAGCGGNNAGQGEASGGSSSVEAAAPAEAQGKAEVHIETEGMGGIAWAYEDDEVVFDEDRPYQSAYVGDAYGQTIHIEARDYDDYEGWHFVKWTKDGADFSTGNRIDVLVDGDVEYVAVFDFDFE